MHFNDIFFSLCLFGAVCHALPALGTSHAANALQNFRRNTPTIVTNKLVKRADPTISDGIDTSDEARGKRLISDEGKTNGAFSQANQLMLYARDNLAMNLDTRIFAKYFNLDQKDIVHGVFDKLTEDDHGAQELAQIRVQSGDPDEAASIPAYMEGYSDPDPILALREDAWVYPSRDTNEGSCETWSEDGMSQDMYLLASIIMHEYTHWDYLLNSIHHGEVIDQPGGYGWLGARALDKNLAIYNADSYAWFATELLWSMICGNGGGGYNDPDVDDPDVDDSDV